MSRRRYISSAISVDKVVAAVEKKYGDFAGLLYDRMIPHAEDDATITGDAEELLAIVFPHRRDKSVADIEAALAGIESEGLIGWDRANARVYFPIDSFYKYQAYIGKEKRRTWDWNPVAPKDAEKIKTLSPLAQISEEKLFAPKDAGIGARARTPSVSVSSSVTLKEDGPSDPPATEPASEQPAKPNRKVTFSEHQQEAIAKYSAMYHERYGKWPNLTNPEKSQLGSLRSGSVPKFEQALNALFGSSNSYVLRNRHSPAVLNAGWGSVWLEDNPVDAADIKWPDYSQKRQQSRASPAYRSDYGDTDDPAERARQIAAELRGEL